VTPEDDGQLAELADAILDHRPLDVDAAATRDPGRGDLIRQLRVISEIAALHHQVTDDPALQEKPPGARRWGPLTLLERIGAGAYGEVFRAWDNRLHREVALKLLHPAGDHALGEADCVEEGRLLARVRHPNVLSVFGAERFDGRTGIWTEFVQGRTLAEIVQEDGPLAPSTAAAIGAAVCDAVAAIHAAGVIHRDVKAQNVMRADDGRVVLMDFGAGAERRAAPGAQGDGITGTPLYTAPEIFDGARAGPQAEIYSVGVLLYYLVSGVFPVSGATLSDVVTGHRQGPVPVTQRCRDLPGDFVRVVERALSPRPDDRYPRAEDMAAALRATLHPDAGAVGRWRSPRRWLAAAVLMLVVGALAATTWPRLRPTPPATVAPGEWVLVASFENRTGDPLFDGTIEYALVRELANSKVVRILPDARVEDVLRLMRRPLTTTLTPPVAREVALRDGAVRSLLTGRIERFGGRLVIQASIVSAESSEILATITEEAAEADVPRAVKRMASQLRAAFGDRSGRQSSPVTHHEAATTPSLKAFQTYTLSTQLGSRNEWRAARQLAQQAVDEDPRFAVAHIWLAWTLNNTGAPAEEVRATAEKAVALADGVSDWERHWILGSYHGFTGDKDRAVAEYTALIELQPDHRWALANLSTLTNTTPLRLRRADLRPHHWGTNFEAARSLLLDGTDLATIEPYWTRANAAMLSHEDAASRPTAASWVLLYPAHRRWTEGDLQGATTELERALGDPRAASGPARGVLAESAYTIYMAMGQIQQAVVVIRRTPVSASTQLKLAVAAYYAGDEAAAAALAQKVIAASNYGLAEWAVLVWLQLRQGLVDDAARTFATRPSFHVDQRLDAPVMDAVRADLELARGRHDHAIALLRECLPALASRQRFGLRGGAIPQIYRASITLADALVKRGDLAGAATTLQQSLDSNLPADVNSNPGLYLLVVRMRLAEIYRMLGREREADALDRGTEGMLALADQGFAERLRQTVRSPGSKPRRPAPAQGTRPVR